MELTHLPRINPPHTGGNPTFCEVPKGAQLRAQMARRPLPGLNAVVKAALEARSMRAATRAMMLPQFLQEHRTICVSGRMALGVL
jgi:hypothetical protein